MVALKKIVKIREDLMETDDEEEYTEKCSILENGEV